MSDEQQNKRLYWLLISIEHEDEAYLGPFVLQSSAEANANAAMEFGMIVTISDHSRLFVQPAQIKTLIEWQASTIPDTYHAARIWLR